MQLRNLPTLLPDERDSKTEYCKLKPLIASILATTQFSRGFPTGGAVFLTGGGAYDPDHPEGGFLKSGGHFRCLEDIDNGPLTGCKAGEGVRWDPVMLLPSFSFKCTGADVLKPVVTSDNTVVMIAVRLLPISPNRTPMLERRYILPTSPAAAHTIQARGSWKAPPALDHKAGQHVQGTSL